MKSTKIAVFYRTLKEQEIWGQSEPRFVIISPFLVEMLKLIKESELEKSIFKPMELDENYLITKYLEIDLLVGARRHHDVVTIKALLSFFNFLLFQKVY